MKRKWLFTAGPIAVVLLGAVVAVLVVYSRSAPPPQQKAAPATPQIGADVILPGRIQSHEMVKVAVPVEGAIAALHVEVGADVYEGQLLAEIGNEADQTAEHAATTELEKAQQRVNDLESTLATARLEASRAAADASRVRSELDRAQRNFQRQKMLLAEGATPRQVFQKAEQEFQTLAAENANLQEVSSQADHRVSSLQRDLDNARKLLEGKLADMEAAKARLAAGQVLSPATGVVAARRGQVGEAVHPAMDDLFVIATDLSNLEITAEPNPQQLAAIKAGMEAAVTVAEAAGEWLPGQVQSVDAGKVVVQFANPSPVIKPGMTGQVRIKVR